MTAPAVDLATRYAAVPPELTACPQWVVWRREARDGRPTKVPYCAVVPRRRASSTDAATWAPFEVAADALGADPTLDGVGFVVTPALGVVGVDVDGCLTANGPDDTARAILDALPGTYCERSPSGRGLRLFVRGTLPLGGNRRGPVEMYAAGRFLTITGERFEDAPSVVAADQAGLGAVHARFVAKPPASAPVLALAPAPSARAAGFGPLTDEDRALVELALSNGNGAKVRRLWEGDRSDYGNDASRADAAFLGCLTYYTRDEAQLDRIFRASKLMRDKWDRDDYRARTIAGALELRDAASSVGRVDAPVREADGRAWAPAPVIRPSAVRLLDAADEPPPRWISPGLIPAGEPGLCAGEDGTMKTTIALHIAAAAAGGGQIFGHFPITATPVLVVSGEDSTGVIRNRTAAIARGHGWNVNRVLGGLHVLALADADLSDDGWRDHLLAEVERTKAGIVILDPLAEITSGDENSNTDARRVVRTWRALTKPTGAFVLLVHHAGKGGPPGAERSKRDRIRGATAIPSASRCTFFLEATDSGIVVENMKQSRGAKHPPFVVTYEITAEPDNTAVWKSARFTKTTRRRAAMSHAAEEILAIIAARPGLTSNAIRDAAKVSHQARKDALAELVTQGRIYSTEGPRKSQLWHLTDPDATDPDWSGASQGQGPTTGPEHAGAGEDHTSTTGPDWSSLKGGDQSEGQSSSRGCDRPPDADAWPSIDLVALDDSDAAYLADERAALEDRAA